MYDTLTQVIESEKAPAKGLTKVYYFIQELRNVWSANNSYSFENYHVTHKFTTRLF